MEAETFAACSLACLLGHCRVTRRRQRHPLPRVVNAGTGAEQVRAVALAALQRVHGGLARSALPSGVVPALRLGRGGLAAQPDCIAAPALYLRHDVRSTGSGVVRQQCYWGGLVMDQQCAYDVMCAVLFRTKGIGGSLSEQSANPCTVCMQRDLTLLSRNLFLYGFRFCCAPRAACFSGPARVPCM
jgi:hypothetical protein